MRASWKSVRLGNHVDTAIKHCNNSFSVPQELKKGLQYTIMEEGTAVKQWIHICEHHSPHKMIQNLIHSLTTFVKSSGDFYLVLLMLMEG